MKKKIIYVTILFLGSILALTSCNSTDKKNKQEKTTKSQNELSQQQSDNDMYNAFGVIKIKDLSAIALGYPADDGKGTFYISLKDVAKYHGKVCPGIATGFKMFQDVFARLYPNGEIPVRGQIKVASSRASDLLDVAGYIIGAHSFKEHCNLSKGDLVVDTTLNPHQPMTFAMVFKRKDNGKMIKVIFHKGKLIPDKYKPFIKETTEEALKGKADSTTANKFRNLVSSWVKNILTNGINPEVYEIKECTKYKFPNEKN